MKLKFILLLIMLSFLNCKSQTVPLYVGTYTNGDSKGIYKLDFDNKTGALHNLTLTATIQNPSFIAYAPNKKHLYAVDEAENGTVSSFKVEKNGLLKLINKEKTFGGAPCHLSVNKAGNKLVASNYKGGNISLYAINSDGSLDAASQVFDHNTLLQKSHAHSAQFIKNQLLVADLGRNAMYLYEKGTAKNFKLIDSSIVKMTENAGPRHFTLTNDGRFIYIINEYASTVTSAKKVGKKFQLINHTSTRSSNYTGANSCADIHLSKDEKFLYASNRGENTIAVFKRNTTDGSLKKIQSISVHGDWPRNFTLDPTGKYVLVANQKSNNISVFKTEATTGQLTFLQDTKLPTPVCLLF